MAKKLTQKEKIEELELKNIQLEETCNKLIDACQDMEKKLNTKISNIEDAFIESPTYLQMKTRIKELEAECNMLNERLKRRGGREEKKHNERGAGAKVRFSSPAQLEQIYMMYESGNTMTDIAQHMGCSVATISRALKSYAQEKKDLQN